jgi:putative FmdB family regulatory protein
MLKYDFKCESCHQVTENWARINEMTVPCPLCGERATRMISCPAVHGDFEPRLVENIAHEPIWIDSKKTLRREMEKHGVSEKYGKGWQ